RGVLRLRQLRTRRDDFNKRLGGLVLEAAHFEKMLLKGTQAAAAMWLRTRRPDPSNPNQVILRSDADRLREWRRWLKRCTHNPDVSHAPAPVIGATQLLLTVHNYEPALQKIVTGQQEPVGTWRELRS